MKGNYPDWLSLKQTEFSFDSSGNGCYVLISRKGDFALTHLLAPGLIGDVKIAYKQ